MKRLSFARIAPSYGACFRSHPNRVIRERSRLGVVVTTLGCIQFYGFHRFLIDAPEWNRVERFPFQIDLEFLQNTGHATWWLPGQQEPRVPVVPYGRYNRFGRR